MSLITRASVLFASSLFVLPLASSSQAGEKALPPDAARWMAIDNCAAYGPGFVPVEGTSACVRTSGHLRVELGARSLNYDPGSNSAGATTAAMRTNTLEPTDFPQHLRVGGDDSFNP
ncbi:MAG TPA: hypothetical protein VKV77_02870 [Methylovirgula sp.]|nr:hypothetical protein [Methylovirgula sp.]